MKTYEIKFTGRKLGAIGIMHPITAQVFAKNQEAAKLALYEHFEHVQTPAFKEIQSPFDSDTLFNRVQNTAEEFNEIRSLVERLRSALDDVSERQASDNAEWHDDKDAPDHILYKAGMDFQFPREMRDKAILELVARHLEILNENEVVA